MAFFNLSGERFVQRTAYFGEKNIQYYIVNILDTSQSNKCKCLKSRTNHAREMRDSTVLLWNLRIEMLEVKVNTDPSNKLKCVVCIACT